MRVCIGRQSSWLLLIEWPRRFQHCVGRYGAVHARILVLWGQLQGGHSGCLVASLRHVQSCTAACGLSITQIKAWG